MDSRKRKSVRETVVLVSVSPNCRLSANVLRSNVGRYGSDERRESVAVKEYSATATGSHIDNVSK